MTTMKNKPVSFNMDNPADKQLYDHINEIKNFSGYMKSLISDDIRFKRNAIKVEVGKK